MLLRGARRDYFAYPFLYLCRVRGTGLREGVFTFSSAFPFARPLPYKQVSEKRSKSSRRYFKFKSTPFCKKMLALVIWGSENLDLMLGFNCFESFV